MFACPKCGNQSPVIKKKYIHYIKAYKRVYVCKSCNETFLTDEKITEGRKTGRPKKIPALVRD